MTQILSDFAHEFRRHKDLAQRAMSELDDEQFFRRPAPHVNPIALIVKHLAGNLRSRWTDFLTTDGEKPDRQRDSEFALADQDSRDSLMSAWENGWNAALDTLASLSDADLAKTITIRGEPHSVFQALIRGINHVAYHTGQILYVARLLNPQGKWLTIAPGQSQSHRPNYRSPQP